MSEKINMALWFARMNEKQKVFFKAKKRYVGYGGSRGGGKAQPLSSMVLTPFGFRPMRDIVVGSQVTNPDGGTSRVIQVHPQGVQQVYKVTLASGEKARCTIDHLWNVIINNSKYVTIPLAAIIERYKAVEVAVPVCKNKNGWVLSYISSIEPDGEEFCQCITVDHPNGLYITDDFIVTHNSWAMRMKFVLLAMQYMDLKLLLLRRTLPELRENHILPLQTLLNGIAKYNSDEKAFLFRNGSRLKLGYCDSDADMSQYQGQEYDVIGFEEATAFQEHWIQFILTCNRSTRDDFKPQAYFTMNPGGPSHGYIKRIFIDKEYKDSENAADYEFIQAKVYDNTVLMETNPEYINVLKALPEHLRKAHLDGDWNVFFGQVFSEFNEEDHVEEPFEIPKSWPRILAMDWGYTKPYAVLWGAIDYDGCIHIYRELYGCVDGKPDTGVQEVPQVVSRKIRVYKDKLYLAVGDPAMWAKQKGKSVAEDMRPLQLLPAKNDRIQGWLQVHMRLKDKRLKIFRTCRNIIRNLPALTYDKNRPEDVDTTLADHDSDALRYMVMSRIYRPQLETKKKKPEAWAEVQEEENSWMGL